ncbi:DUF4280 domain-containing protein [Flavobacterium amniphilum]|uniref:PAAR-like protein n=1 Tax=Flavobacterium amniphilum TaxID=1834035 RepID=UPI002029DBD6|nr:PAAR-like protein [Flavobacterium amniphilum]MCL9805314.1 DUF4280 domain-containing protein [Flavobacterium amniphilum]
MSSPIPYKIQKGDTLGKIAAKLKIKNWKDLQVYHNNNCPLNEQIGINLKEGNILYTPPQDKIDEMNGVSKGNQPEPEKKPEDKKQEEKPKEEEKKEEKKEDSKSEHDGKYYVVHGATCVCDKAEDPTKVAELQVTTHQKMIYNDQAKKWAATEEDKQFNPPAATFGKCKLKPSSGGYQPCALAPAPKWDKPYDKTKVLGKCVLTEISELKCTVGGKITIKKHGQTDAATTAHAENTNPAEMAHANPAVKKPVTKAEYPAVDFITIESIENRTKFKPVKSNESKKEIEKIYVRPDENCSFTANVVKGKKDLTSWVVYDVVKGKTDKKILTKEQIGTSFSNAFPAIGDFRVEGYGKPKTKEFENGKYDTNDVTCSIDVTVAINKLVDGELELDGQDFAAKIKSEVKLRKDFLAAFKAKFLMSPTKEELDRLEMFVTDEAGNRLTDFTQEGKYLTFTPTNADAVYNFHAIYQDDEGNTWEQSFKGKTLTKNYVVSISHTDQVVREFSAIGFEVKQMTIGSVITADSDLTDGEIQDIKWNLNGVYQNSGRVLGIPKGLPTGKYVVEAYCSMANAFGVKAKKEEDDWHFEVKRNDVADIQANNVLKVGRKTTLTASDFIFKDLKGDEKVNWTVNGQVINNTTAVTTTPRGAGNITVTAKINTEKGISKNFTVVQPVLENVMFTDSHGIQIEKSSWGNKVYFWLKEKHLTGEKLKISLQDEGVPVHYFPEKVYDGGLIELDLNADLRKYTKSDANLKVVVSVVDLDFPNEGKPMGSLEVGYGREVYSGQIGSEDGRQKHVQVDYDMISWFYGKSRGIKENEKVTVEICEYNFMFDDVLLTQVVSPDKSGVIKVKIDWSKIPKGKQGSYKNIYVKVLDNANDKAELYSGKSILNRNFVPLRAKSMLIGSAGYSSAAVVGSTTLSGLTNGNCACKVNDLIWGKKVSCDFRKRVVEISKSLGLPQEKNEGANWLMSVMALETGRTFSPTAGTFVENKKTDEDEGGYVGLIQFGKVASIDLGVKRSDLAKMSAFDQLEYVEKYFKFKKFEGKLKTKTDLYLAVNYQSACGHGTEKDYVVYDSTKSAYDANKMFKREKDEYWINDKGVKQYYKGKSGASYVWEFEEAINEFYEEGKAYKAFAYSCMINGTPSIDTKDIMTYNIYESGFIEKNIPKEIKEGYKNKYQYLYIDSKYKIHNLGVFDFASTNEMNAGNVEGNDMVELLDARQFKGYSKDGVKLKFLTWNSDSQRWYINPDCFAGLLGAMAKNSIDYLGFNGFSDSLARSVGGSSSHRNGEKGDLRYLSTNKDGGATILQDTHFDFENQNKFNDALYLFGWGRKEKMYSEYFTHNNEENTLLRHTKHMKKLGPGGYRHYHHLHLSGFDFSLILINKK